MFSSFPAVLLSFYCVTQIRVSNYLTAVLLSTLCCTSNVLYYRVE
jgi:hypothetical protein